MESPNRSSAIAYVSTDRQIFTIDRRGDHRSQTGADPSVMWGWWGSSGALNHSWPTWSPDGGSLACFATSNDGDAHVVTMEVDGVSSVVVADIGQRLPIYLHWSADGSRIAILSQMVADQQDRLHLATCRAHVAESERYLARGTPLFFTWAADHVACFVGNGEAGRSTLAMLSPDAKGSNIILPGQPGNFCAPVWLGDRLLYVVQRGDGSTVVTARSGDPEPTVIEHVRGLVALVKSPCGRMIARAVAPEGDGTPYRHIAIYDIDTNAVIDIADRPCLAFMWMPDSSGLLTAEVDTDRNIMRWYKLSLDGVADPIVDTYPTRDFGFYLRFFEQYTQSHMLVNPASTHLLLAGALAGHQGSGRQSKLWEVPLSGGAPKELGEGLFGVYSAQVQTEQD
ncbi:MAG: hypothetical protein ACI9MC_002300 [Kiritimatiellia bacterium]